MEFYGKYLGLWQLSLALILNIFLTVIVYISCIEDKTMEGRIYWARDEHVEDKENVQNFGEEIPYETSTRSARKMSEGNIKMEL